MKHCFLTLIALLGISYANAQTHTVYFLDDVVDPAIEKIVDQNNVEYVIGDWGISEEYTIADGTILTFTMKDETKIIYCQDDNTTEIIAMGLTFTINSSMPEDISFSADDPATSVYISLPDICSLITAILKDGEMDVTDDAVCRNGYLELPGAKAGDVYTFKTSVDTDWSDLKQLPNYGINFTIEGADIGKVHTIVIKQVDLNNGQPEPIGVTPTEVWKDEEDNSTTNPGEYTIAYINRTIYAGMWNTICFPFDVDQTQMEKIFGAGNVYQFDNGTFSESEGLTVECSKVTSMTANTPYFVKPENNIVSVASNPVMKFVNVEVKNFNGGTINGNNGVNFVGVVRPTLLNANDKTKLFIGSGNKVYYPDEDMTIKAFRCYFEIPAGLLAPGRKPGSARFIIREQAPTAVEMNNTDKAAAGKYLKDGRLVIENNGVRYNAQGQQID